MHFGSSWKDFERILEDFWGILAIAHKGFSVRLGTLEREFDRIVQHLAENSAYLV